VYELEGYSRSLKMARFDNHISLSISRQISLHWCRGGVWIPKSEKFTEILEYKCPTRVYPFGDFYQIFRVCVELHGSHVLKVWHIRSRGFGVILLVVFSNVPLAALHRFGDITIFPLPVALQSPSFLT